MRFYPGIGRRQGRTEVYMPALLKDKVALVTGGASGIGRVSAGAFAREGAKVVIADIDAEQGAESARHLAKAGAEVLFVACDVTHAQEVQALIEGVVRAYGRLDCAFNNAGFEGDLAPTAECTEENWDRTLAVNLKAVWLCMKYEIQQMLGQRGGAIVNMGSVAALVAERGFPAYAAAKGGVLQLTRTAAVEYAGANIRINAVCPGVIDTPMATRAMAGLRPSAMMPGALRSPVARRLADAIFRFPPVKSMGIKSMHPLGRMGKPEEVAEAAVWLCSEAASFVTGHALPVDGGLVAQ
jgi:NAD(P)-dependent dehydrogenase (short-subunit alcohol dehydrogenase family)